MSARAKRILVIDDSKLIRHLGKSALEKAGHEVTPTATLSEALAVIAGAMPDLLLVDINMPEMRGDDMVPLLRRQVGARTPIVLFSDIVEADLKRAAIRAGATTYISKHWGLKRMADEVGRLLDGHPPTIDLSRETPGEQTQTGATATALAGPPPQSSLFASQKETSVMTPPRPVAPVIASPVPPTPVPSALPAKASPREDTVTPQSPFMMTQRPVEMPPHAEAEPPAPDAAPADADADADAAPAKDPNRKRQILLIDDSGLICQMVKRALTKAGHNVAIASKYDEIAKLLIEIGEPDLILVDINMPDIMGDDLVVFFRRRWEITAPIVLFSNVPENELEFRANEAGANGFVSKRWGLERLVTEVARFL